MTIRLVLAGALALAATSISSAPAQVIYQPVQYQYATDRGATFYYGGNDAALIARAQRPGCLPWCMRSFGYIPVPQPQRNFISQHPFDTAPVVYGDCEPDGAAPATISDAVNEAYARVPLYFRKADLLPAPTAPVQPPAPPATPAAPPPAHAAPPPPTHSPAHGTIDIHPYVPTPPAAPFNGPAATTRPSSQR